MWVIVASFTTTMGFWTLQTSLNFETKLECQLAHMVGLAQMSEEFIIENDLQVHHIDCQWIVPPAKTKPSNTNRKRVAYATVD